MSSSTHQEIDALALSCSVELRADPVSITFGGRGWQGAEVVAIRPDGNVDDIYTGDGSTINRVGSVAFPLSVPGTWQFHLSDTRAGCAHPSATGWQIPDDRLPGVN